MKKRSLGSEPDEWNDVATLNAPRSHIEREWERDLWRSRLPTLRPTDLCNFGFIKSRTLDWQRFAEAIPMSHFRHGITDNDGAVSIGEDGRAFCSGTGIKKEDTIRASFQRLQEMGLITIFPGRSGTLTPANIFMPFSRSELARQLVAAGGVLPQSFENVLVGEHHVEGARMWRVEHHHRGALLIREALPSGLVGQQTELAISDFRRPTVREWLSFSGEENKKISRAA